MGTSIGDAPTPHHADADPSRVTRCSGGRGFTASPVAIVVQGHEALAQLETAPEGHEECPTGPGWAYICEDTAELAVVRRIGGQHSCFSLG